MNSTDTRPASDRQIAFLKTLVEERDLSLVWTTDHDAHGPEFRSTAARSAVEAARAVWREQGYLPEAAFRLVVDYLKAAPRLTVFLDATGVPEGMHRTSGGEIYKVQRSPESGRVYAKRLAEIEPDKWEFHYARGALRYLSEDTLMTLEQAKEFGALYGTCCVCARTLTNEESIAAGIGPVCAGRLS